VSANGRPLVVLVALVASPNQLNSFIGMFWIFYNVFVEFLIDFENDLGVLESFYLLFFVEFALEDFLNCFFFLISSFNIKLVGNWTSLFNSGLGFYRLRI